MNNEAKRRKDFDCRFVSGSFCSVQIVNSIGNQWNSRTNPEVRLQILRDQILALNTIQAGYPIEIVVIDDSSDRSTVEYLVECYSSGLINMLFLNNTHKIGNCFAKNIGLAMLESHVRSMADLSRAGNIFKQAGEQSFNPKYVALAENDVVPIRAGWLADLVEVLENNPDVGFANSIDGPFSERDYHALLYARQWKGFTLEYRRQIPGSFFLCCANTLREIGAYTTWDFRIRGQTLGYDRDAIPEEYRSDKWYGAWDEEFCLRFARNRRPGVNVKPARLEHRVIHSCPSTQ